MQQARVKKIHVDQMMDYFIMENEKDHVALANSRIYCGCCGGVMAELSRDLRLPCMSDEFIDGLKPESITFHQTVLGVRHDLCRHTMFSFNRGWSFISLDVYLAHLSSERAIKSINNHIIKTPTDATDTKTEE